MTTNAWGQPQQQIVKSNTITNEHYDKAAILDKIDQLLKSNVFIFVKWDSIVLEPS